MGMQHWTTDEWTTYLEAVKARRKPWRTYLDITEPQRRALRNLFVPQFVIDELNRHEALTVISQRIEEAKAQKAEERRQYEEWKRKQQERRNAIEQRLDEWDLSKQD